MISLLWQDSVLSLLDQSVYPQEERWLTCTSLEETVQVLSSGAILEEKIAAIAGAYGLCQAALAAQDLQQTPQFDEVLAGARAMLLESRNHSRDMQLALDFMADPPEAYTRNVDRITTLLATAVTFERQQVVADRNTARNGTDLMSEGTRVLLRTDRGAFHSAAPTGALGIARRGWKRKLIEQVTLCEGRPSLTAGTLLAQELSKDNVPCTLIPDQAAATFLARQGAHMVLVDGMLAAKNGDLKAPWVPMSWPSPATSTPSPSTPCSMPTTSTSTPPTAAPSARPRGTLIPSPPVCPAATPRAGPPPTTWSPPSSSPA